MRGAGRWMIIMKVRPQHDGTLSMGVIWGIEWWFSNYVAISLNNLTFADWIKSWVPGIFAKTHFASIYFAQVQYEGIANIGLRQNKCLHSGLLRKSKAPMDQVPFSDLVLHFCRYTHCNLRPFVFIMHWYSIKVEGRMTRLVPSHLIWKKILWLNFWVQKGSFLISGIWESLSSIYENHAEKSLTRVNTGCKSE